MEISEKEKIGCFIMLFVMNCFDTFFIIALVYGNTLTFKSALAVSILFVALVGGITGMATILSLEMKKMLTENLEVLNEDDN